MSAISGSLRAFSFIYVYVISVVAGDAQALLNGALVSSIKLSSQTLNPEILRREYFVRTGGSETFDWNLDPFVMESF